MRREAGEIAPRPYSFMGLQPSENPIKAANSVNLHKANRLPVIDSFWAIKKAGRNTPAKEYLYPPVENHAVNLLPLPEQPF